MKKCYSVLSASLLTAVMAWSAQTPTTIQPDDTVTIFALNVDEISRTWRVNSAGELNLPMVGRIVVNDMPVAKLESEIAARLRQYVKNPYVTVHISEFHARPVTVSGAVDKPGILQMNGPSPLLDILAQVGGPKDGSSMLTLTRPKDSGPIPHPKARPSPDSQSYVLEFPVREVLRGSGEEARLLVQPHDSVHVSMERRQRLVHMAGKVIRPGAIELLTQDSVALTKAVAMAGGLNRTASPGKTIVRHFNSSGQMTAIAVIDLKAILAGKKADIILTDGDTVIVPGSQVWSYLQTMMTSAATASIYLLGTL